jgi:hypothetical protein
MKATTSAGAGGGGVGERHVLGGFAPLGDDFLQNDQIFSYTVLKYGTAVLVLVHWTAGAHMQAVHRFPGA